jgi:hypothetical protein
MDSIETNKDLSDDDAKNLSKAIEDFKSSSSF